MARTGAGIWQMQNVDHFINTSLTATWFLRVVAFALYRHGAAPQGAVFDMCRFRRRDVIRRQPHISTLQTSLPAYGAACFLDFCAVHCFNAFACIEQLSLAHRGKKLMYVL